MYYRIIPILVTLAVIIIGFIVRAINARDISKRREFTIFNAIQLSIISVVFCHREPLFFMPKNFKNITKNS